MSCKEKGGHSPGNNGVGSHQDDMTEFFPLLFCRFGKTVIFLQSAFSGILPDSTVRNKQKHEFDNAIRLVKKMDSMSCMAGGMAHDFNNLLTVICGNLDMINLTGVNSDMHENGILLESARKAAYLTVDLTRKISCFSPFGIISREDVIIEELVASNRAEFFRENPDRYSCRIGKKKNCVNIDREQIAIAISNVLQNAVEAGATGEISISVVDEIFDAPSIRAGQYVPEGNFVRVSIEDNGKGY